MIGRLLRSFSTFSLMLLFVGFIFLGFMIKMGEFPFILMPSHDYEYVLENGLKKGQHIKGEIFYSLGSFASEESYTQYEDYRTASKTTGYYYLIPVGENGMAAIDIYNADVSTMETLTEETYQYLMGGNVPQTVLQFEGVAVKMDTNLKGLENAFREQLEYMGYTDSEVEDMLAQWSDGECLVLTGPAQMSTMYVMIAIMLAAIFLGFFLIVRNYRKELKYDEMRANGLAGQPRNPQMMGTSESTTTYYNGQQ